MTELEKYLTDSLARQARNLATLIAALTALIEQAEDMLYVCKIEAQDSPDHYEAIERARAAIEQAACDPTADWEAYMEICRMGGGEGDA